jgi:hypothetical protein
MRMDKGLSRALWDFVPEDANCEINSSFANVGRDKIFGVTVDGREACGLELLAPCQYSGLLPLTLLLGFFWHVIWTNNGRYNKTSSL